MLSIDIFYTCHLFPAWWSPYSPRCSNTCWNWHFPVPNNTTKDLIPTTPSCLLSSPTLWKPSGSILSPIAGFFGRSPTRAAICLTFYKCSFKFYANMFLLMCRFTSKHVVINSSYHICISFIFGPFPYNITYSSWLATSYNSPWYILKYYRNYCFGEWNTCLEGGLPPSSLSHPTTSGYSYH
jgi:hypothetical protein